MLRAAVITASMAACSNDSPVEPVGKIAPAPVRADVSASPVPANDDLDGAVTITIADLPFTDELDTSGGTIAADDPGCFNDGRGATVWYQFTPTEDIRVVVNTFGSEYDTSLGVYTGTRGELTEISCNDFVGGEREIFTALAGETYRFMVATSEFESIPGGNLVFNLVAAPPPLEGTLTINSVGSVDQRTGEATIRGTVSCSRHAFVDGSVELQQKIGRLLGQGSMFLSGVECLGPTPTVWEVRIRPFNGVLLVGGPADVSASVVFDDPEFREITFDDARTTVRLRR